MSYSKKLNKIFKSSWNSESILSEEISLTYEELYNLANSLVEHLRSLGHKRGDKIAIRLPNGPEYCVAYFACILGNYVFVPVNMELSSDEQNFIIQSTSPKFTIDENLEFNDLESIKSSEPSFLDSNLEYDAIFFTSGTTGKPKGVCHSLEALIDNVISFNVAMGLSKNTRMYHVLPMAYMAGFLNTIIAPIMAGGCVLVGLRFDPSHAMTFWNKAIQWSANTIWITPTLASILIKFTRDKEIIQRVQNNMENIFCGTAPLSEKIRQDFITLFNRPLQESFGMSEILIVSAQTKEEAMTESNVGKLLPNLISSKRTTDDQEELLIKSPWALKFYLVDGKKQSPLTEEGFMPTGDIGEFKDMKLSIVGRIKDLIIRGGINISPFSIENCIQSCDLVEEVAVVGVPHEFWGEQIISCIVLKNHDDKDSALKDIKDIVNARIAENMKPDKYLIMDTLPKNSNGKILKSALVDNIK